MGRFGGAAGAGRAGGAGDVFKVERDDDVVAGDVADDDRERVGQSLGGVAGQLDAIEAKQGGPQAVTAVGHGRNHLRALGRSQLEGRGHAHGAGHVLRAGAAVALLAATVDLRQDGGASADPQRTHALGSLHLVCREGDQVRVERLHVDGQVGGSLDGIDMDPCRGAGSDAVDERVDGLDGADLVVGQLQAHEDGLLGQGGGEVIGVDLAVAVDRQPVDIEAVLLQQQA